MLVVLHDSNHGIKVFDEWPISSVVKRVRRQRKAQTQLRAPARLVLRLDFNVVGTKHSPDGQDH